MSVNHVWTRQPPPGTQIAWGTPETAGLVAAYTPTTGILRPGGVVIANPPLLGGATLAETPDGLALRVNAGAHQGISLGHFNDLFTVGQTDATFLIYRRARDAVARASTIFGYGSWGNVNISAPWHTSFVFDFGPAATGRLIPGYTKDTALETIACVAGNGLRQIWRRGVLFAQNAGTGSPPIAAPDVTIGYSNGGAYGADNDDILGFAYFNRILSAAEIQAWNANPWRLYRPISLDDGTLRPALLFDAQFLSGTPPVPTPLRVWAGVGDLVWGGHTWLGAASVLGVTPIEATREVRATGFTVTLSGVAAADMHRALAGIRHGLPGVLRLALLDSTGAVAGDPLHIGEGRLDTCSLNDSGTTATISVRYESRLVALERVRALYYTPEDQQLEHPGDRGFDGVAALQDATLLWGA